MAATLSLPVLDGGVQRPRFAQGPRSLAAVRLLRLSVTDRCNLRCIYCMPEEGTPFFHRDDLLTSDDILAVARAAREAGVTHFKVTGGEPTVRRDLLTIIRGLAALEPHDLSLTTNGLLLPRLAHDLARAGLHRLTLSIDTLRPDRFTRITGGRGYTIDDLHAGLDAATDAGFDRLKLNMVVMGGINDDEVVDLARLSLDRPWTVRFIEYMPLGDSRLLADGLSAAEAHIVDNAEVMRRIEAELGALTPVSRDGEPGVGPAKVYRLHGARGRVGFISAMSRPFCETCNRLRLTARGELRACLFDGGEVSVLPVLRDPERPADPQRLIALMRQCVAQKPEVHSSRGNRPMSQMGG